MNSTNWCRRSLVYVALELSALRARERDFIHLNAEVDKHPYNPDIHSISRKWRRLVKAHLIYIRMEIHNLTSKVKE